MTNHWRRDKYQERQENCKRRVRRGLGNKDFGLMSLQNMDLEDRNFVNRGLEDRRSFEGRGSLERMRSLKGLGGMCSLEDRLQECSSGLERSRSYSPEEEVVRIQSRGTGKGSMHRVTHRVMLDSRGLGHVEG